MKLTKKLEAEILKAYNEYWDAYLKGDMRTMSHWMHDEIHLIGSGRGEFFDNKKKAIKYYKSTVDQVAGKADMRDRKITLLSVGEEILVNEECNFFVLIDSVWTFYEEGRISTLFAKTKKGWRIIQEHGSMPDARTSEGEQVNTDEIKAENIRLKNAVKRRTIELEEKNYELKIEAALDRVRARTMAMHRSDELAETAHLLYEQFRRFCDDLIQMTICIVNEKERLFDCSVTDWAGAGKSIHSSFQLSIDEPALISHMYASWKKKEKSCVIRLEGKRLHQWIRYRNKSSGVVVPAEQRTIHSANFSKGCIAFSSRQTKDRSVVELLERFAGVLDLTYTRFLDLQKAEAQAREAQIEVALERVRAKAMAMHRSDDLKSVALELRRQMGSLGLKELETCAIHLYEGSDEYFTSWAAMQSPNSDSDMILMEARLPRKGVRNLEEIISNYNKGKKDYLIANDWKNFKAFSQTLKVHAPEALKVVQKTVRGRKQNEIQSYWSVSDFGGGSILMSTVTLPNEDFRNLLRRFANVFDLAYRRFSDLQKAEAQAREAQIEVALERVRAQAMAMHQTEDLGKIIMVYYEQLDNLIDSTIVRCGAGLLNKENTIAVMSTAGKNPEGKIFNVEGTIDMQGHPLLESTYKHWLLQDELSYVLRGNEIKEYYQYITNQVAISENSADDELYFYFPMFTEGSFYVVTNNEVPEIELQIFRRFSSVLSLTYRRFNDLQKAEAQARESQIQLGLERVRARTMAMQHSNELAEIAVTIHKELVALGFTQFLNCGYVEIDERNKTQHGWSTNQDGGLMEPYHLPLSGEPALQDRYDAWKRKEKLFCQVLGGKDLKRHIGFASPHLGSQQVVEMVRKFFPDPTIFYCANFSHGYLSIITGKRITKEEETLLIRFTKEFEQSYARFLDLQKAEAQAREAQIEAALERVRSKTMAIQRSEELDGVIKTVYSELKHLDVSFLSCFIMIFDEQKGATWWMAGPDGDLFHDGFYVQYHTHPPHLAYLKGWEGRQQKWEYWLGGQIKKDWDEFIFSKTGLAKLPPIVIQYMKSFDSANLAATFENFGCMTIGGPEKLSEESFGILSRFAKVFDQTYTRFNDLKNAEAQAREAEIQLALERIRARTMAMQRSDELLDVITIFSEQLANLKIHFDNVSFGVNIHGDDFKFWLSALGAPRPIMVHVPYIDNPATNRVRAAQKKGLKFFTDILTKKENERWINHLIEHSEIKDYPEKVREFLLNSPGFARSAFILKNINLYVGNYGAVPYTEEENNIFQRFSHAFEQSYTRFLDLEKAEAQARESEIQLALERVRARTMAMQKSDELAETASLLFKQIGDLGLDVWSSGFQIWNADDISTTAWMSTEGGTITAGLRLPYTEDPFFQNIYNARRNTDGFFVMESKGKELEETYRYMFNLPEWKKFFGDVEASGFSIPKYQITHCVFFGEGYLMLITHKSYPEYWDIFKRFGKVFDQTYTRFLDLQKAEAQAREAEIQLALERVRARTMAMHKSDELRDVVHELFIQLNPFGLAEWGFQLRIAKEDESGFFSWLSTPAERVLPECYSIPSLNHWALKKYWTIYRDQRPFDTIEVTGKDKLEMDQLLFEKSELKKLPDNVKKNILSSDYVLFSVASMKYGLLEAIDVRPKGKEEIDILQRFAKVFEQTYTRFLDLQKAEAQAREARIEAALEKVRSRSLAMHKAEELGEVAAVVFEKLRELDIPVKDGVAIVTHIEGSKDQVEWMESPGYSSAIKVYQPYYEHPILADYWKAKTEGLDFIAPKYTAEQSRSFLNHIFEFTDYKHTPQEIKDYCLAAETYSYFAAFQKNSSIFINDYSGRTLSEPEIDIVKRFSKVFEQAYVRFLDLQKAEAQAREAQIEAALERVRSRTMGMQKSEEIADIVGKIFVELRLLDLALNRVLIWIFNDEERYITWWSANPEIESNAESYRIDYNEQQVFLAYLHAWQNRIPVHLYTLSGDLKKNWEDHLFKNTELSNLPMAVRKGMREEGTIFTTSIISDYGLMMVGSFDPLSEANTDIIQRFGRVFQQSYTRYLDVQRAEGQALEAIKRASVDRVRAEIASMRTTKDLERITPLIWNELKTLGVPFIRCGVFIMDDERQQIETHLSTPGGEAIATFNLPYNAPGETVEILAHWRRRELYKQHWNESQFIEFTQNLVKQGAITSGERYLTENRPTDLHLHFLPFLQGMLYAGNTSPLNVDELHLMQNLADAFSTAYARYEDFNKLEAAKKQVDNALNELRATQKQLIQSEKMASLGELTAGIAHEIQNPLNFVNNFSEVNAELIDELKNERSKVKSERNEQSEDEILDNIKNNTEKIIHHGKRADSIVRGMLQHSRNTSTVRELTNINTLADEYFRLAYHGLRAKDKSFNAILETDFDETIGKIDIIPQDIGRVILNIITNAFYAVNEKAKLRSASGGYAPRVTVETKKINDKIQIKVSDNGNGIPKNIIDKIFQPFFTTKPTGEGTGLGLSLAYDIIKAHGGEIKVETKEGEGTEFIIRLPA